MIVAETPTLDPGIYEDIPSSLYHQLPYLGSSTLKKFRDNPATCRDKVEVTRPMILGEASHAYSLEGPDAFHAQFVVAPEFEPPASFTGKVYKATNDYKARVAEFEAKHAGRIILDADEGAAVMGLDKSLREHPSSRELMNRGANELTVIWDDPGTGLRCKARIDDYPGHGIANDYKTTNDISRFISQMRRMNYLVQAGHYTNGLIANGEPVEVFVFIAGQTEGSYPIRTGRVGWPEDGRYQDMLAASRDEATRLIGLYAECLAGNVWPNFAIPGHIFSLSQLQEQDLLEDWNFVGGL